MTFTTHRETMVDTTFSIPISFECLQGCGLCCSYKVHVTPEDISRLESRGMNKKVFISDRSLKKKNGFCQFMDEQYHCSVYPDRPSYCRAFPFYTESLGQLDIDLSCPGIGQGEPLGKEDLANLLTSHVTKRKLSINKSSNTQLDIVMKMQPGYIDHETFCERGLDWCEEIKDSNSVLDILMSAESHSLAFDIDPVLQEHLFSHLFNITRTYNIHKVRKDRLIRYKAELVDDSFILDAKQYTTGNVSFPHESAHRYSLSGIKILIDYLKIWFRRELFYRFCLASSIQVPLRDSPTKIAFSFLQELIKRIISIADILMTHWQAAELECSSEESINESIRFFDGRLRTKCRGIVVQLAQ